MLLGEESEARNENVKQVMGEDSGNGNVKHVVGEEGEVRNENAKHVVRKESEVVNESVGGEGNEDVIEVFKLRL